jgi:phosphate/sulfate permease
LALKRDLSLFDLTNIVVGAIIGSDIYIASALTASLVGPFSVVLWVVAGLMAIVLAMIFAYSAYFSPKVDMADLKEDFLSAPKISQRYLERTDRFLARLLKLIRRAFARSESSGLS